jgi:hypothetical protein
VYNGTDVPGEAGDAAANLKAMGMHTSVGHSGYSGYQTTTIYYPAGDLAEAQALADKVVGSPRKESSSVNGLTLVLGSNAPSAIVAAAGSGSVATAGAGASPSTTISVEARNGDENICSNLPAGQYGGRPSD